MPMNKMIKEVKPNSNTTNFLIGKNSSNGKPLLVLYKSFLGLYM